MKTTVLLKNANKNLLILAGGLLLALTGVAQTYTTQADGSWSSATTWVGGLIPPRNITTGMTVNIKHDVTCNLNGDVNISGIVNVEGDTLRFPSSFQNKVRVNTGGHLIVKNGGFLQYMIGKKNDLEVAGRVFF